MIRRLIFAAIPIFLLLACSRQADDRAVAVSVIGSEPKMADPNISAPNQPDAVLIAATAQGLVRHDAAGQIEPGLAIRWAISDDGLYYTFRLGRDDKINAEAIARQLKAAIAARSRNPLKPLLGAIREIVAVTPEVVEIRLVAPRPNLLDLLAQPELGMTRFANRAGPFVSDNERIRSLHPLTPPLGDEPPSEAQLRRSNVLLRGERAGLAVARFMIGDSDLVLGGRYADLAIARAGNIRPRDFRIDPVSGLFGLQFVNRNGVLAVDENRRALAMAIDRARLLGLFGLREWSETSAIVAPGAFDLPRPAQPRWSEMPLPLRQQTAAATIAAWRQVNPGQTPRLRIALPAGPGSRLLLAGLRRDWAAIGVDAERVGENDPHADIRLIDAVAPSQSATWYLRYFSCDRTKVCSEAADQSLAIAREMPDLAGRTMKIAEADVLLAESVPFIPLGQPLRWSLVAPRLIGFQTNNRGAHPFNHLLDPAH